MPSKRICSELNRNLGLPIPDWLPKIEHWRQSIEIMRRLGYGLLPKGCSIRRSDLSFRTSRYSEWDLQAYLDSCREDPHGCGELCRFAFADHSSQRVGPSRHGHLLVAFRKDYKEAQAIPNRLIQAAKNWECYLQKEVKCEQQKTVYRNVRRPAALGVLHRLHAGRFRDGLGEVLPKISIRDRTEK